MLLSIQNRYVTGVWGETSNERTLKQWQHSMRQEEAYPPQTFTEKLNYGSKVHENVALERLYQKLHTILKLGIFLFLPNKRKRIKETSFKDVTMRTELKVTMKSSWKGLGSTYSKYKIVFGFSLTSPAYIWRREEENVELSQRCG